MLERLERPPDLAVLFVGGAHRESVVAITGAVRELLGPRTLLGCTAASVAAGPQEIEDRPAIALWAGQTGACEPVRLETASSLAPLLARVAPDDHPRTLVLLTDPATFGAEDALDQLAAERPGLTVVGALASGGSATGANRLMLDGAVHVDGAVGVLLPADLAVRSVVSQGCRPIGEPFVVTRVNGRIVQELGGQTAMARLDRIVARATPEERALLARGVHLGIVIDERQEEFRRGDFLVRAVLGAQRATGGVAIGDEVALGTTVQFHVRDAVTADEDLRLALAGPPADAALLFTCVGRGEAMFGEPDHDALLVHAAVGGGAVGGMFSAGEIGRVGLRNFVHGYTASVLLFGG